MYSDNKNFIKAWFSMLFICWFIFEMVNFLMSSLYFQEMCRSGIYLESFAGLFPSLLGRFMF